MEHGGPIEFNTSRGRICAESFGDPNGRVVFYLHGQFSSRKEAQYFHYAARARRIRLIALDRPGFGGSPPVPRRNLADWPPVMLEIADQLGAGRFGVLGISAGAKFALATGLELPDRVTAVVLASAFGPLGAGGMPATLANNALPRVRATLWFYRRAAQVAPWLSGAVSALAAFVMKQSTDGLIRFGRYLTPRTEREVFGHPEVRKVAVETFRCSAAQGGAGMEKEFQLIVEPWGLALDQLRVPVVLFHGIEDRVAPFGMATALAKQIPGARLEPKENCGHVSLLVKHATEILEPL